MPLSTDLVEMMVPVADGLVSPCRHDFVRVDVWTETEVSEISGDDIGVKSSPVCHRRMTKVYEMYRCRRCDEEDLRSETSWDLVAPR